MNENKSAKCAIFQREVAVTKHSTKTWISYERVRGWHETGGIENIHRWWFQPENKAIYFYPNTKISTRIMWDGVSSNCFV